MTTAAHNQEIEQRLCEATMAILQNVPSHRLNIVLVNKALFYADLYALREFGKTITATAYLGLPQGPVVANYPKRVVSALEKRGWAKQLDEGMSKPLAASAELKEFPSLNSAQLGILSGIAQSISRKTSTAMSVFSHENAAWKKAYARSQSAGGPPAKLNMMLAMQQLPVDDDEWLASPLTVEESAAFAAAQLGNGEEWV